ncbi:MAG TPA: histidinol-phosphate transaminase [Opitutaceae bacterium]|nr:histidinol-phosphate transaminase [Opitutaceae bacterium]
MTSALPHVLAMQAYVPGLQPSEPGWTKLNTNECPYPPSPAVAAALRAEIGEGGAALRLYPHPSAGPLRSVIAELHAVAPEQVCVGNGSDDLLNLLVRCCCGPEAPAGFTVPSYSLYPVLIGVQGGAAEKVEFDRSFRLPVERIGRSRSAIFFLTSPNAPSGVGYTHAEIAAILAHYRGILVVDEAYAPFAEQSAIALLPRHRNLVVVRTLSKAYALAGIRVGYALADPEIIGWLDRVRDSYNVSRLSQAAAAAALKDRAYHEDLVARIRATRDASYRQWTQDREWFTYPSQANFLFTEPRGRLGETGPAIARLAYEYLYAQKILVRHFPSHALTASFLRVTVGTDDEMNRLNRALDAWQRIPIAG